MRKHTLKEACELTGISYLTMNNMIRPSDKKQIFMPTWMGSKGPNGKRGQGYYFSDEDIQMLIQYRAAYHEYKKALDKLKSTVRK